MDLKFEFDNSADAFSFSRNLTRSLKVASCFERDEDKHLVVVREKSLTDISASALAVSIVTAGLVNGQQYFDKEKFILVIEAMQRANPALVDMTSPQIGEYLASLSPEQLQGVVSNTKGVYHEMLYVDSVNSAGGEAVLHEDLNNPGSDVVIREDGALSEVQLKATDNVTYVNEHIEKYPDIDVVATTEVAAKIDGVESSGFSNESLEQDVTSGVEELIAGNDTADVVVSNLTSSVAEESIGLGPISILTGLLFGIF
ncbi:MULTISPECIES: hypothetical protein [unclassified Oleiphilus]|uniref:hypothetical protein n=1 Tax=unclassified Oleiphilus TaxID=2631174 RepID=UPI0007C33572|nr:MULTISPECIES: hypothetical protein [unclassified Oleiphilus]KZY42509.1 hypothetical protein A3732_02465 [Oleiphilus sp. HI0050]KZY78329.1 hypothetical protein A3740_07880 [Oleiphilus sp. HI0068]KZY78584.1 hypothetical protein A3741_08375 [Oleiphilus sp. HI0069]KZZ31368.1 hypothetical protein A3755_12010 [Oleiphilus sp. HI0085]KZZ33927.1 hypothetical protein A3757_00450 [Oleiphilus sp. HI0117]